MAHEARRICEMMAVCYPILSPRVFAVKALPCDASAPLSVDKLRSGRYPMYELHLGGWFHS
jgi:hypothetical protein